MILQLVVAGTELKEHPPGVRIFGEAPAEDTEDDSDEGKEGRHEVHPSVAQPFCRCLPVVCA